MLSRRAVLLGAATGVATVAGVGAGVEQGVLPGRPWLQARLGLNGEAGLVPDVEPGPVETGSFVSEHRLGARTGWCVIRPPGAHHTLPVVIALHGLGQDHASLVGPSVALDRYLAAAVAEGAPPYAIAAADGGRTYWHPRPDGEDASAMVVDELLPLLADRGLHARPSDRVGLLGWSMGGYGALRLAGLLGPARVAGVVAASPAIWSEAGEASSSGFADADEYEAYSVLGRQEELTDIPVRIDCGTGDPFYRDVEDYVGGFPEGADVASTFQPGAHDLGYWRRMLPDQLAFLGATLPPQ